MWTERGQTQLFFYLFIIIFYLFKKGHSTQRKLNIVDTHSIQYSVWEIQGLSCERKNIWKYGLGVFIPSGITNICASLLAGIMTGRLWVNKSYLRINKQTNRLIHKKWAEYFEICTNCITNLNDSFIRKHKSHHQGFIWNLVELPNEKDLYQILYCSLWTSIWNPNVMSSRNRFHGYKLRLFWDNNSGLLWHI